MSVPAVSVLDLSASYGPVRALRKARFEIPGGSIAAILGPDGAGKTTMMKILAGILDPEDGEIRVLGLDWKKNREELKDALGYLSQRFSLYGDLSVDENVEFFAELHGVRDYASRRNEILEFTRLTPFRRRPADRLSGGMKQKLALACNLIHRPRLLLLDEPTTGVDPVSRRDFRTLLTLLLKDGVTILMTTPYMDEAERCDPVILLDRGEVLDQGSPRRLAEGIRGVLVEVACSDSRRAAAVLKQESRIKGIQLFGDRLHLLGDDEEVEASAKRRLEAEGIADAVFRRILPGLEDVFIARMKNEQRSSA